MFLSKARDRGTNVQMAPTRRSPRTLVFGDSSGNILPRSIALCNESSPMVLLSAARRLSLEYREQISLGISVLVKVESQTLLGSRRSRIALSPLRPPKFVL